jgi:hypothetical protein
MFTGCILGTVKWPFESTGNDRRFSGFSTFVVAKFNAAANFSSANFASGRAAGSFPSGYRPPYVKVHLSLRGP